MAKVMLKKSGTMKIKRSVSKGTSKFDPNKTTTSNSVSLKQESYNKASYMSSNCSTSRLITDSESEGSTQNEAENRKSSYRRQFNMQNKYGSRKIRKKTDVDQLLSSNTSKPLYLTKFRRNSFKGEIRANI
jgi:hypothetical protein